MVTARPGRNLNHRVRHSAGRAPEKAEGDELGRQRRMVDAAELIIACPK
jgi:hypothetical protein